MNLKIKILSKQSVPLAIALIFFVSLLFATIKYTNFTKGLWEKDIRTRILEVLIIKKTKLEKALYSRIYYTRSVAAYVSLHPTITNSEFYNLAEELIKKDSVISTMSLSKDCIIGSIYPIKGHETAVGLNLLSHPERKDIVEKTIKTQKSFVAGPVELVEGGIAFISYTPIFDKTSKLKDSFWGVTDIVIYQNQLLAEAKLNEFENGLIFALRGYNGSGSSGAVFWGDKNIFSNDPVCVEVELPYGSWLLGALPKNNWSTYFDQDKALLILLIVCSFIISILIWVVSKAILKIRMNEQELKAIFSSLDSLIIEYNNEGKYINIAPTNKSLLFKSEDQLLNKTVFEIFDQETALLFHRSILECLKTKQLVTIEYPLTINSTTKWFLARISCKTKNSVIFHSYDYTEQRKQQDELIKSEISLKEVNATKDKFFSIIAHDLKNPFNLITNYSELLLENYSIYDKKKVEEVLQIINSASNSASNLVGNLLIWAQSQTNRIEFNPQAVDFKELVSEDLSLLENQAKEKNIDISSSITKECICFADKNMMNSVFRNLISNAIKYTHSGGSIAISSSLQLNSLEIAITDNGIGMSKETCSNLFKIDKSTSTLGTANEKGTGLGLIICKEFIEKHGGRIWVDSIEGKGSSFHFQLPIQKI